MARTAGQTPSNFDHVCFTEREASHVPFMLADDLRRLSTLSPTITNQLYPVQHCECELIVNHYAFLS
jgi:hypothetical protein